jgi:hypothetical protein
MQKLTAFEKILYKELYRKSFYDFVKAFWHTCDPAPFIDGKLVQFYCEVFQYFCKQWVPYEEIKITVPEASDDLVVIDVRGPQHNLCLNVPPRHSKSMVFNVLGPTWTWLSAPTKAASISHTSGLAGQMNTKRQAIINSDEFQTLYGNSIMLDTNTKGYLKDTRGAELYSLNRDAMTGYGADIIINDDLTNAETARKDMTEMTNAWAYYRDTMPSRINNINKCFIMNVQQRLAVNDITGQIMQDSELAKKYKFIVLPAVFEKDTVLVCPISGELIYFKKGEGLWPERFGNYESLRAEVGQSVFETQYQQHPLANDDTVIKEELIIKKPITEVPAIDDADMVYASHDFPVKDKDTSDFLGSVVAYRVGSTVYIKDCLEKHMAFTASIDYVKMLDMTYPGIIQIIEDKANGSPILQQLQDEVSGMQAYNPGTASKTQRLEFASLFMRAKNVVFIEDEMNELTHKYQLSPALQNLVNRLLLFPLVAHDDIVDAFDMLVNFVFMDRRFMVYGRAFTNDNMVDIVPKGLYSNIFINKEGDLWKATEIAISYAEHSKLYIEDETEFKASVVDGINKLKAWKPNASVFVDCSANESLSGIYENGIDFEHYTISDFDKSVTELNLAFSKKLVLLSKKCVHVKNDIEMFKFSSNQKDETVKYRTEKDGFVATIRMAMNFYGGIQ